MTIEEIRNKRDEINEKLKELTHEREKVLLDKKHLEEKCKHPNKWKRNFMGRVPQEGCEDCGMFRSY